jgi:hypothetical protein
MILKIDSNVLTFILLFIGLFSYCLGLLLDYQMNGGFKK